MGGLDSLQNVYMGLWFFSSIGRKKKDLQLQPDFLIMFILCIIYILNHSKNTLRSSKNWKSAYGSGWWKVKPLLSTELILSHGHQIIKL